MKTPLTVTPTSNSVSQECIHTILFTSVETVPVPTQAVGQYSGHTSSWPVIQPEKLATHPGEMRRYEDATRASGEAATVTRDMTEQNIVDGLEFSGDMVVGSWAVAVVGW